MILLSGTLGIPYNGLDNLNPEDYEDIGKITIYKNGKSNWNMHESWAGAIWPSFFVPKYGFSRGACFWFCSIIKDNGVEEFVICGFVEFVVIVVGKDEK